MTGQNDEARWSALMAAAQTGDRNAYDTLLRELGVAIANYLTRRLGPMDLIEDCVQECLIAVHKARHTYDARRPFRAWLFAIVRNKSIDMLRRREAYTGALERHHSSAPMHDPSLEGGADGERVLEALAPEYREAITLTKIAGYSIAEAAEHAGVSEGAMKTRVSRAIRTTRRLLAAEGQP